MSGYSRRLRYAANVGSPGIPSNQNTTIPTFVVAGASSAGSAQIVRTAPVGAGGALFYLSSTRGASINDHILLQNGDGMGTIEFLGSDGDHYIQGAEIVAQVDGTPGNDDMPSRLSFRTANDGTFAPTEKLQIKSNGAVIPGADNTQPLGSVALRWNAVYAGGVVVSADVGSGQVSSTTLTNVGYVAGANAYVIKGFQAASTQNTGFLKMYFGLLEIWVPYWQNPVQP